MRAQPLLHPQRSQRSATVPAMALAVMVLLGIGALLVGRASDFALYLVPASDSRIHYGGRWDIQDTGTADFSWPGVYFSTRFHGTAVGIRLDDNENYYNIYIDDRFHHVFHGTAQRMTNYTLATGLPLGDHTLRVTRRNCSLGRKFTFGGIVLGAGHSLLPPPPAPVRRIEFVGDSYTAALANEAREPSLEWHDKMPLTNLDEGFAAIISRHFQADYATICCPGMGLVCDWQGNPNGTLPNIYHRALMDQAEPAWDSRRQSPDVIVVALGLNDHSGLVDAGGQVSDAKSERFRRGYLQFITTLRRDHPQASIVAVAAHKPWLQTQVQQVVAEATRTGESRIFYAHFDYCPNGYVADGHPTVATHRAIARQLIDQLDAMDLFSAKSDKN